MTESQQNTAVWVITLSGILCLFLSYKFNTSLSSSGSCTVKGNISLYSGEKIYHLPGDKYYDSTIIESNKGEKVFCSTDEAEQSGWRRTHE